MSNFIKILILLSIGLVGCSNQKKSVFDEKLTTIYAKTIILYDKIMLAESKNEIVYKSKIDSLFESEKIIEKNFWGEIELLKRDVKKWNKFLEFTKTKIDSLKKI